MDLFTLKDFVKYTSPCFLCEGKMSIHCIAVENKHSNNLIYKKNIPVTFYETHSEFLLETSYFKKINVQIINKSNKFNSNNLEGLTSYLKKISLSLHATCEKCENSFFETSNIKFNLEKLYLEPFKVNYEYLLFNENDRVYRLMTIKEDKAEDASEILVKKKDEKLDHNTLTIKLPVLTKSSFKNKEHFFKKIKSYVLLS